MDCEETRVGGALRLRLEEEAAALASLAAAVGARSLNLINTCLSKLAGMGLDVPPELAARWPPPRRAPPRPWATRRPKMEPREPAPNISDTNCCR